MDPEKTAIIVVDSDAEFDHVYRIRKAVFQDEFGAPEERDLDGNDHMSQHYLVVFEGRPVGVGRWRITLGGNATLERIAVLPEFRGGGIGTLLVRHMLRDMPPRHTFITSLPGAVGFFEKLGFKQNGEAYEMENQLYQDMTIS